jgi:type I restriction enzyme S subunit
MSKIDELIAELCPEGVAFHELRDVALLQRGTSITKKDVTPGNVPVIAGGRTPAYYHNESNRDGEIIVVAGSGAYAGFVSWWSIPIFVSDAFSVKPIEHALIPKYCYYWLQSIQQELHDLKSGGGVPHVYARDVGRLRVPVPPIEVQREIVKVLDTFTELKTELETELEARRKQYAYYRDSLLTFKQEPGGVRWVPIGELGEIFRGKRFTKEDYVSLGGVGVIHYGEIYTEYGTTARRAVSRVREDLRAGLRFARKGDVVLTDVGETVEDVGKAVAWLGDEEVAIHDHCYVIRSALNPAFLSYFMQTAAYNAAKDKHVARAKVKTLLLDGLKRIFVPVPSPEEQARIVAILNEFDMLVNDLSTGLPAEIKARRQQYEYYRDKLLTFEEAA